MLRPSAHLAGQGIEDRGFRRRCAWVVGDGQQLGRAPLSWWLVRLRGAAPQAGHGGPASLQGEGDVRAAMGIRGLSGRGGSDEAGGGVFAGGGGGRRQGSAGLPPRAARWCERDLGAVATRPAPTGRAQSTEVHELLKATQTIAREALNGHCKA